MRSEFLPFSRPSISRKEIDAVIEVLTSGWITTGKKSAQFEQKICHYTGCAGAVALCSATGGMHLLLKALDIGPGDEVITPSMTWVSTVNLTVLAGATPVFVDIDRETLMMRAESLEGKITPRTRLIIPVHFAGAAADMDILRKTVSAYSDQDIFIAEDAAHAIGTEYKGKRVGRQGTSIFSFHPIKNITTGEGGMFCSDDEKLLNRVRQLKFHGLGVDAYDRHTQSRSPQAEVLEPGYKYNMTDIAAVLGLGQLSRLQDFNRKRAELASLYLEKISGIHEILPLAIPCYQMKHSWHLFIVRLDIEKAGMDRDEFMRELKGRNIGTGIHFRAVHLQKYYSEAMQTRRGMLPNTEWNSDRILSLPLFPDMTEKDIDSVIEAIKEVLR
ncbi:MAG: UDP-4-amino-4-deoxy-L-arabinose aminotransferase [Deltaproteobacteria bacterium]|nr:MAG: UDP-4-amino-4-deoxy-L-arabinose aminotransferase [Deltaproteobacteria bacterium]RLB79336.1 MAG: UDP-4-amino-4-deoxy-L-arabinose aminotransferase [Deltaproteobacteria bacterium]